MLLLFFIHETPTERSCSSLFIIFCPVQRCPCLQQWCSIGKCKLAKLWLPQPSMWFTSLRDAQVWHALEIGPERYIAWQKQDTLLHYLWFVCQARAPSGSFAETGAGTATAPSFMGTGQDQSLWPCQNLFRDTCTNKTKCSYIFSTGIRNHTSLWLNCWFTVPRLLLGEPDFGYTHKLALWPNMPLKLVFQAPVKKLIKKSEVVGLFCLDWGSLWGVESGLLWNQASHLNFLLNSAAEGQTLQG